MTSGGGGSSWVLERLEREGRKLGYALGGGGGGGSGGDPVASSSSAATGSDAAMNGAVRRESSSAGSTVGSGASKVKVKGVD